MRIFVGYGYNDDDKWVEEMVFPLIKSFGFEVVTGKDLFGKNVPKAVLELIKSSDGVIAFLTRRNALQTNDTFSTHRWCIEELIATIPDDIPSVEIRDKTVEHQDGMVFDRQRIDFDIEKKDKLLVEIAKLIGEWQKQMRVKIIVLSVRDEPGYQEYVSKLTNLECIYSFSIEGKNSLEFKSSPYRALDGNIVVKIKNIPESVNTIAKIIFKYKTNKSNILSIDSLIHHQFLKR